MQRPLSLKPTGTELVYRRLDNHPQSSEHPGNFAAWPLSGIPPLRLVDATLEGLRAQLPPNLQCHPTTPENAVRVWFAVELGGAAGHSAKLAA